MLAPCTVDANDRLCDLDAGVTRRIRSDDPRTIVMIYRMPARIHQPRCPHDNGVSSIRSAHAHRVRNRREPLPSFRMTLRARLAAEPNMRIESLDRSRCHAEGICRRMKSLTS